MGAIKRATLARHNAPPFGAVDGLHEVLKLRQLTGWMRWLFLELRMLSDFRTGQVETSWAVLQALMDCDSGERGGPRPFVPSVDQLRRAVDQLCALGLVTRNGQANQGAGRLFLHVPTAVGIGASGGKPARGSARVRKPRSTREKAPAAPAVSPGVATGDSAPVFITPPPLQEPDLSTENRQRLQAVRDGIAAGRGGEKAGPRGGLTMAR